MPLSLLADGCRVTKVVPDTRVKTTRCAGTTAADGRECRGQARSDQASPSRAVHGREAGATIAVGFASAIAGDVEGDDRIEVIHGMLLSVTTDGERGRV
jgi:hypothetical protein